MDSVLSHLATLGAQNKFLISKVQALTKNLSPKDSVPAANSLKPSHLDAETQTDDASESIKLQQKHFELQQKAFDTEIINL